MKFIIVTRSSGVKVRVNFDLVLSYYPSVHPSDDTLMGSEIRGLGEDTAIWVRETADELDRLISPTRTP